MKSIIKFEEVAMFGLALVAFAETDLALWLFPALLLTPDISMVGYLANSRVGAVLYNIFHHKALAVCIYVAGVYLKSEWIQLAGIILFAHSSMDRAFGYGLKYKEGFAHTHLGLIGNQKH
jgi:hypothetical protein